VTGGKDFRESKANIRGAGRGRLKIFYEKYKFSIDKTGFNAYYCK
jgi:hypothetical protein